MNRFRLIIVMIIFIGILVGTGLYLQQDKGPDKALAGTIAKYKGWDGVFRDPTNELGVNSEDDLSYKLKEGKVELRYGNVMYNIDIEKDLKRVSDSLAVLGVEMGYTSSGSFVVRYKGKPIKQLAP